MKSKRLSPKLDTAIAFLTNYLASGNKPATEVIEAAKQRGITEATLDKAVKHLKVDRSQRKGHKGHFWTLSTPCEACAPEGTLPATASFLVAYENAQSAGCLSDPRVAQLAEAAHLAIKGVGHPKPVSIKPSLWPFPTICLSSLMPAELFRMLQTVNDPLIVHLLAILDPFDAHAKTTKADAVTDNADTESEYDDGWSDGYHEAILQVEIQLRDMEGGLECPQPSVTSIFKELQNRLGKLGSGSDSTVRPLNRPKKHQN